MRRREIHLGDQEELLVEVEQLRNRLMFVEETLRAIHSNEVDAIIMQSEKGERVFAFEEAERPYRILIEEMSEGAVCLNENRQILYCNRFFETLLGQETGTMIGRSILDFVAQEDHGVWQKFAEDNRPGSTNLRMRSKIGDSIPCRMTLQRLQLNGAMDVGLIITDLRERIETEKLLKKKFEDAEQTSRMKDEFLATVSHELRTPLTVIGMNAILLQRVQPQTKEYQAALESLQRNIQVQSRMVEDVLDISKFVAGKMTLEYQEIDISTLLKDAIESIAEAAEAKAIAIRLAVESPDLSITGDGRRIRQIIWNLLSNAIKFTPAGGRVELKLSRHPNFVELIVADTGEGITASFLPQIFERFTQEDSTPTRAHQGMGLGLAIARYLTEAHGGTIKAESPGKGKGTTFTVTLPAGTMPRPAETLAKHRK